MITMERLNVQKIKPRKLMKKLSNNKIQDCNKFKVIYRKGRKN